MFEYNLIQKTLGIRKRRNLNTFVKQQIIIDTKYHYLTYYTLKKLLYKDFFLLFLYQLVQLYKIVILIPYEISFYIYEIN